MVVGKEIIAFSKVYIESPELSFHSMTFNVRASPLDIIVRPGELGYARFNNKLEGLCYSQGRRPSDRNESDSLSGPKLYTERFPVFP